MKDTNDVLVKMYKNLNDAGDSDQRLEHNMYAGHAAICKGLEAVVFELRNLRKAIEKKP